MGALEGVPLPNTELQPVREITDFDLIGLVRLSDELHCLAAVIGAEEVGQGPLGDDRPIT